MIKKQDKKRDIYVCIFLGVLTFVVYLRVLGNDFVNYDDNDYITDNIQVKSGLNYNSIKWAFTKVHTANWHPITWLSHMADYQLFGMKPWGHHLTNLLLHIVNTLMLFTILNAMTGAVWRSAFVAVIFAIHPLNVGSVAWVAERKNVLSTIFWLLTMGSYWKYSKKTNARWYLITLFLFAVGLMSKPMLVTLSFVLLLMDYWPIERLKSLNDWKTIGRLVVEKIPFFALSLISSIITFLGQKVAGAIVTIDKLPLSLRLANAITSYGKYITKGIWPTRLGVLYLLDSNIETWKVIVSLTALSAISIFVIIFAQRSKYLLVGWLWYLGTLVPVIGLIQVGEQLMADRYAYIPMIGFLIMVGWGMWEATEKWLHRDIILKMSAVSLIFVLSILAYIQLGYWKNSITLFERTLSVVTRDNGTISNNLGLSYTLNGEYTKAVKYLEQAVRIKTDFVAAYINLGNAYMGIGNYRGAEGAYKKAIQIKPDSAEIYNNLNIMYNKLGRYQEGIEAYKEAVRIKPDFFEAHLNTGVNYRKLGRYEEAIEAYKEAIRIRPNSADAYCNLGNIYGEVDRYQEAVEACKQAIKIQPDFARAHVNLGFAYVSLGNKEAAMEEYRILKKLNPQMAEILLADINK